MIADSPSQERGVAHRPPTAGASSKRTPSGSEVMSSACSPASRWCGRSISTAFGALRSNSLSLSASALTILLSFFPRCHLREGRGRASRTSRIAAELVTPLRGQSLFKYPWHSRKRTVSASPSGEAEQALFVVVEVQERVRPVEHHEHVLGGTFEHASVTFLSALISTSRGVCEAAR